MLDTRGDLSVLDVKEFKEFILHAHLPVYEDGTECSETSAYKIQSPGNHTKESTQHGSE